MTPSEWGRDTINQIEAMMKREYILRKEWQQEYAKLEAINKELLEASRKALHELNYYHRSQPDGCPHGCFVCDEVVPELEAAIARARGDAAP